MKHLKMLGLAAIAALGLMAFVGAGTASATTLATDKAGTIHYEVGTTIHATLKPGTSATLHKTNGELIATCTELTVHGFIEDPVVETGTKKYPSGTWVTGKVGTLLFPAASCSQTTDTISTGSLEIMQIGTEDRGEVRSKNASVTISVFGVSCTYGTGEGTTLGTISGGEAPEMAISAVLPRIAGSTLFCPSTGVWTATMVVTSPHALHIVS